jgi:hypothetical protein
MSKDILFKNLNQLLLKKEVLKAIDEERLVISTNLNNNLEIIERETNASLKKVSIKDIKKSKTIEKIWEVDLQYGDTKSQFGGFGGDGQKGEKAILVLEKQGEAKFHLHIIIVELKSSLQPVTKDKSNNKESEKNDLETLKKEYNDKLKLIPYNENRKELNKVVEKLIEKLESIEKAKQKSQREKNKKNATKEQCSTLGDIIGKFASSINRLYLLLSLLDHSKQPSYKESTIKISFKGVIFYGHNDIDTVSVLQGQNRENIETNSLLSKELHLLDLLNTSKSGNLQLTSILGDENIKVKFFKANMPEHIISLQDILSI